MIVDDTLDEKMKVNESINEINELIDSISNTTPVKSFECRNSSGVNQLEGSQGTLKESEKTPKVPEKPTDIYAKKLTDIFDYCVQELDGDDNESIGKVDPPTLNAKLNLEMEKTESAHPVVKKSLRTLGLPPSMENRNPSAPDVNKQSE